MRVVWLAQAETDLDGIFDYLLDRNPQAALHVLAAIREHAARLADFPELGRPGRVTGTRELVIVNFPYILPYYRTGAEVRILAVMHAARKWPDDFSQ